MNGKRAETLPGDVARELEVHGLRRSFEALSGDAQRMYLTWIDENSDGRTRRIELLVRSLRREGAED